MWLLWLGIFLPHGFVNVVCSLVVDADLRAIVQIVIPLQSYHYSVSKVSQVFMRVLYRFLLIHVINYRNCRLCWASVAISLNLYCYSYIMWTSIFLYYVPIKRGGVVDIYTSCNPLSTCITTSAYILVLSWMCENIFCIEMCKKKSKAIPVTGLGGLLKHKTLCF
jgi:hypothetical protein